MGPCPGRLQNGSMQTLLAVQVHRRVLVWGLCTNDESEYGQESCSLIRRQVKTRVLGCRGWGCSTGCHSSGFAILLAWAMPAPSNTASIRSGFRGWEWAALAKKTRCVSACTTERLGAPSIAQQYCTAVLQRGQGQGLSGVMCVVQVCGWCLGQG